MKRKAIGLVGLLLLVGFVVHELDPEPLSAVPPAPSDATGPCAEIGHAFSNILPALDEDAYVTMHFVVDADIVDLETALASDPDRAWIVGFTNLPDGTAVDVRADASGGSRRMGRAVARGGCFELPIRHVDPALLTSLEELEVTTGCLDEEAPAFRSVLAETRGHLRGDAVVRAPCLAVRQTVDVRPRDRDPVLAVFDRWDRDAVTEPEREVEERPARRGFLDARGRREIARLIEQGRALGDLRRQHHAGDLDALVACNERRVVLDGDVRGLLRQGDPVVTRELLRFHEPLLTCTSCDAAHGDSSCDEAASMLRVERERALARRR